MDYDSKQISHDIENLLDYSESQACKEGELVCKEHRDTFDQKTCQKGTVAGSCTETLFMCEADVTVDSVETKDDPGNINDMNISLCNESSSALEESDLEDLHISKLTEIDKANLHGMCAQQGGDSKEYTCTQMCMEQGGCM